MTKFGQEATFGGIEIKYTKNLMSHSPKLDNFLLEEMQEETANLGNEMEEGIFYICRKNIKVKV